MQNTKLLTIEELKAEKCRRSLHFFLTEFWEVIIPEPFVDAPHIKFLCDEVQKVGERIVERKPKLHDLIINITPGTTKSTIATVVFPDRKSTRLNSSHVAISYAVFCLKKKKIIYSNLQKQQRKASNYIIKQERYIQLKKNQNQLSSKGTDKNQIHCSK